MIKSIEVERTRDDAEVMRLWRECGLPEFFLGNGGTNHKLVEFAKRVAATEKERIAKLVEYEASVTPCYEDAVVTRDLATLIRVEFSYEDAERYDLEHKEMPA